MTTSKLYFEVFNQTRKEIFEKLSFFKKIGGLAGGTAISLQLAGRYSYDFDIFTSTPVTPDLLDRVLIFFGKKIVKLADSSNELSLLTKEKVKISFVYFPFPPLHPLVKTKSIYLYDLRDLASNKAYVIGRRGEYRDYVDMVFLLKDGLKLKKIAAEAEKRFAGAFSERLFLEQLVYFEDLKDFRIDFIGKEYSRKLIREYLKSAVKNY